MFSPNFTVTHLCVFFDLRNGGIIENLLYLGALSLRCKYFSANDFKDFFPWIVDNAFFFPHLYVANASSPSFNLVSKTYFFSICDVPEVRNKNSAFIDLSNVGISSQSRIGAPLSFRNARSCPFDPLQQEGNWNKQLDGGVQWRADAISCTATHHFCVPPCDILLVLWQTSFLAWGILVFADSERDPWCLYADHNELHFRDFYYFFGVVDAMGRSKIRAPFWIWISRANTTFVVDDGNLLCVWILFVLVGSARNFPWLRALLAWCMHMQLFMLLDKLYERIPSHTLSILPNLYERTPSYRCWQSGRGGAIEESESRPCPYVHGISRISRGFFCHNLIPENLGSSFFELERLLKCCGDSINIWAKEQSKRHTGKSSTTTADSFLRRWTFGASFKGCIAKCC